MGLPFGAGVRFLLDANQRLTRAGLAVYLRIKNVDDSNSNFTKFGFQLPQTASGGFTDIKISPPPEVNEVSLHNIGLNQARLHFGARTFRVSHTFVLQQMRANQYTDPLQVWRNELVIGLFYDGRLFSIEDVTHEDAAGEIILWKLICNATDQLVSVSGG